MLFKKTFLSIFIIILSLHVYLFSSVKIYAEKKILKRKTEIHPFNLQNVQILKNIAIKEQQIEKVKKNNKKVNKKLKENIHKKIAIKKDYKLLKKNDSPLIRKLIPKHKNLLSKKIIRKTTIHKIAIKEKISDEQKKILIDNYLLELKNLIEKNKQYPKKAKRLNQEGLVILKVEILKDGIFSNMAIKSKSKFKRLNNAALKILKDLKSFKKIPAQLAKESWIINIPIEYKIVSN
jgi:protein TonB